MIEFPAPISLCAITSLIGVTITAAIQLIQDHKIETGWPLVSVGNLIGYSLLVNITRSLSLIIKVTQIPPYKKKKVTQIPIFASHKKKKKIPPSTFAKFNCLREVIAKQSYSWIFFFF